MASGMEQMSDLSPAERGERFAQLLREREERQLRRFPLSFAQQRLWLLNEMEGGNTIAYNIPVGLWLQGRLNVAIVERCFGEVMRRHDALRTTFQANSQTGAPEQVIHPWKPFKLEVKEVSSSDDDVEQEQRMRRLASEENRRPFNLKTGPLVRAVLLRESADRHVLLIMMHHIVSDGWSMSLMVKELAALYEAYSEGSERPALSDLPIQYVDYANWQRKRMTSQLLEGQLGYWKKQLKGPLPVLELPTRGPRPAVYSTNGAVRVWNMSRELSDGAKALSRRKGVTLFMTLMAAFKVLLYRYTGQEDILVGTPIAGRGRREVEGLIGVFINTLVLRTDLSGELTFREILAKVKEAALGAYANQDLPFEKLVEELQPERDLSRSPIFQVMFVLQNAPMPAFKMADVVMRLLEIDGLTSKFDMTLAVLEKEDGILSGWLEHNTTFFDQPMIEQIISHYENILKSVIANPDERISRLPMLNDVEYEQLLGSSSYSAPDYREGAALHELFEAQVESSPDAVAVVHEGSRLTYRDLNCRANKLAHHLRLRGVGPEVLVGISVERSAEMIVGLLGILKAGGAYVPLDASYPQQRLAFVLEDARIGILLTQQAMLEALPQTTAETICLDRDWEIIDLEDQQNPPHNTLQENAAYVIYTSGSTGKPKGVLVSHANVARLFEATDQWYRFDDRDVWTLFHSCAFDFSVWELWGALLKGGELVMVPYLVSRSPQAFYETLRDQQVTVLNQTPSAFRQVMQVDEANEPSNTMALRLVIFGGEALDLQSLRPWFERHGDKSPELVNMYGITETTVHVTYRALTNADSAQGVGSLIGTAIPDLRVYVLDKHMEAVAFNVQGEMYVGGAGVSRGYLSRPELTAERFIPDPFSGEPGRCLYKTGDLARRQRNGDIEYLGRIDNQVKIRGFRIELGEIEATLYEHPQIKDAVVVARDIAAGEKQLVAYLVADHKQPTSINELRSLLKKKLPDYMVPGVFVVLEVMPLTGNGKVDISALPAPERVREGLEQEYVGPRTEVEEALVGIFAEILGVEKIGVNDNFFELGGHSLLATLVLTRIVETFKTEVPLRRLFETPSVAGMAEAVSELQRPEAEAINPITRISRPVEELLLANLDQLTDQQVEALLADSTEERRDRWTAQPKK